MRQMLAMAWAYLVIAEIVPFVIRVGVMMMPARRFLKTDEILSGIVALTRALAREPVPDVLVNAIAPRAIGTEMSDPARMTPEQIARDLDTPLARSGDPEEIASMAVYLAGPESGFITGQCFGVNGGSGMH